MNLSKLSIFQLAFPTACVPVHVKWYLFFPECESIVLNDMEGHQRLIKPFLVEVFSVLLWLKSLHFRYHLYFRYSSLLTVFHSKILLFQVFCGIFIQWHFTTIGFPSKYFSKYYRKGVRTFFLKVCPLFRGLRQVLFQMVENVTLSRYGRLNILPSQKVRFNHLKWNGS